MDYCYCPYCMGVAPVGQICPDCGNYPQSYALEAHHFPTGYLLAGRYVVGKALGEGGFGITYLGLDTKLERRVAIKEYFPRSLVHRDASVTCQITGYTGSESYFEKGRTEFLREAQVLAKLDAIPEIVHVLDYFAENNSAYIVMEFLEGVTLKDYLASYGVMDPQMLLTLLEPVLTGLDAIHKAGLIHRDISPDNLMILSKTGKVKLMDFGCAREVGGGHTMTVMLKPGFAPVEQYTGHEQGPWSDVYALCATIYYCLTGRIPPVSMQRAGGDTLIPLSQYGIKISQNQERALMKGLAVHAAYRFRSARELREALYGNAIVGVAWESKAPVPTEIPVYQASSTPQNLGGTEYFSGSSTEAEIVGAAQVAQQVWETEYVSKQKPEEPKVPSRKKRAVPVFLQTAKGRRITLGSCAVLLLLLGLGIFWMTHPHNYGDWMVTAAATCTQNGSEARSCFCGAEETRALSALGHTVVKDDSVASTCTAAGLTEGSHCSTCKAVLIQQNPIPKLEHVIVESKQVAATCSAEGKTAGKICSLCREVFEGAETIAQLPHKPVNSKTVKATCAKEGKQGGKECSVCKVVLEEPATLAMLDHKPVKDKAVAATCAKEGKTEGSHCSVCKTVLTEQQTIARLDHTPVTDKAVAATCNKEGKTEGSHCSVCKTVLKEQTKIQSPPHTWKKNACTVCKEENVRATLSADKEEYRVGEKITITAKIYIRDPAAAGDVYYTYRWGNSTETEGCWLNCKDGQTITMTVPCGINDEGDLSFNVYHDLHGENYCWLDGIAPKISSHIHTWKGNVCTDCSKENVTADVYFEKSSYKVGDTATVKVKIYVKDEAAVTKKVTVIMSGADDTSVVKTISNPVSGKTYSYTINVGAVSGWASVNVYYDYNGSDGSWLFSDIASVDN